MIDYMKYGPFLCIGFVLTILFLICVFWGTSDAEFVGLKPLLPDNVSGYTGAFVEVTPILNIQEETVCVNEHYQDPDISEEIIDLSQEVCEQEEIKPVKRGKFLSKGERICGETMEKIYGVPFISVRPDWLRNPETGEKLELDCYNEELKLAVEYNGEQHYHFPNFTNQTQEQFINQTRRDELKMKMCDQNGVYLIVVPYTVKHKDIPSYLISRLPEVITKTISEDQIFCKIF